MQGRMSENEKRYSGKDVQRMFLEWRGIDPDGLPPCEPRSSRRRR